MTVIAEGIETFEELAYLQAATKIRYAQGYYFSKPIFLEELVSSSRRVQRAPAGISGPPARAGPQGRDRADRTARG